MRMRKVVHNMRETPDIDSSTDDYATRFSGPTGAYLLNVQNEMISRMLSPWRGGRILDVGGGHAQLCGPLLNMGYSVTVLGSDQSCFERVRKLFGNRVECVEGDLLDPPFGPQTFDAIVSIRMLAHLTDTDRFISGLCRIARNAVVVDYPDKRSVNAITPLLFNLKKNIEGNTRTYRLFRGNELKTVFAANGFKRTSASGQFFWPMVLHRKLNTPGFSRMLESLPRFLGLTRYFGSPVCLGVVRK